MSGKIPEPTSEGAGLPSWLFNGGYFVALLALATGLVWPQLDRYAVSWMMLVPVLGALYVAAANWRSDRRLSFAALLALAGLALVLGGREFVK